MPVLTDSVDRHPGTRIPRNALYFDGSVGVGTDYEDVLDGDGEDDDDDEAPDLRRRVHVAVAHGREGDDEEV